MRVPAIRVSAAGLAIAACALLANPSCAFGQGPARSRPVWTERSKSDDSIYAYFVGHAAGVSTRADARQAAIEAAAARVQDDLALRSGLGGGDDSGLRSRLAIVGMEPVPDAVHYESSDDGEACWIMVSYPLAEREKLLRAITAMKQDLIAKREARQALDARLNEAFRKARIAAVSGDAAGALALLREPMAQYGRMTHPDFELEEAQLLAGDLNRDRNESLAARAIYETVSGTSTSKVWRQQASDRLAGLPRPPRFWPLRMRLGEGPMALVVAIRTDHGAVSDFPALRAAIRRDLVECRIPEADIGALAPAELDSFFNGRQVEGPCRAAAAKGARVLLAAICRVDSTRKGTTQDIMGVPMPVPDSSVEILVVNAETRATIYEGQFKEMAGSQGSAKAADRIASIMIHKYLVPRCPGLSAPRGAEIRPGGDGDTGGKAAEQP